MSIPEYPQTTINVPGHGDIQVPLNTLLHEHSVTQNLRLEQKKELSAIAREISDGAVYVIDFGNVVGYVCNGSDTEAQQKIRTLKQIEDPKKHPFPLITSSEGFAAIIDAAATPKDFSEHVKNHTLPQGVHFRIKALDFLTDQFGTRSSIPEYCYSNDHRGKVVQIVIFGSMFPKAAYLIGELRSLGVDYIVATSANLHNQPETQNYRKGQQLAQSQDLPFYDATISSDLPYLNGSYPGIDVTKDGITLFRPGHFLESDLDILFQSSLPHASDMRESRYHSVPLPAWLVRVIFSLPPSIQSPFFQACAKGLDKKIEHS